MPNAHTDSTFPKVLGLAGVSPDENTAAIRWAERLEWPMLLMAVWIAVEWYLEAQGSLNAQFIHFTDWTIWLFFVFETAILTYLVHDKKRYLRSNWVNVVIIVMGLPMLWSELPGAAVLRTLRLLVLFGLLIHVSGTARRILAKNHLGTTLLIGFILMVMAGFLIAGIDPAISDPWEGIWWAWVTVTTVGYGDIVPVSTAGRLFGAILILMGIGLFSLLTANFSAFFISREEQNLMKSERRILSKLDTIEEKLHRIEKELSYLYQQRDQDQQHDPAADKGTATTTGRIDEPR